MFGFGLRLCLGGIAQPVKDRIAGGAHLPHGFTAFWFVTAFFVAIGIGLRHSTLGDWAPVLGVLTAGLYNRWLKLEGSLFHGREPDENRWNFDFGALDSWSARLSVNPTAETSLQISYGFLKSPEALIASDQKTLTRLILWPVRFMFTARTGDVGRNGQVVRRRRGVIDGEGPGDAGAGGDVDLEAAIGRLQ